MEFLRKFINRGDKKELFFISIITIFAVIYRIVAFNQHNGLFIDEMFSLYFIKQNSFQDLFFALWNEDVHAPFYFFIMKIFNDLFKNSIFYCRVISSILSTLIVPISFYVAKKIFNKETGYITAILFTINAFLIYHSVEIRFYGILALESIITTYFQIVFLKENKHSLGLIISSLCLIFTLNIGILFVFLQFFVGLIYLFVKKYHLKKYFICGFLTLLLSIPIIVFLIKTSVLYNNSIFSFAKDIFYFDGSFIINLLQSYFSNLYYAKFNNFPFRYNLILLFFSLLNILLGLLPISICLYSLFKSLKTKNDTVFLIILPSIIFILIEYILAYFGMIGLICRHTMVAFPAIIMVVAFGLNSINKRNLKIGFIICLIFLQTLCIFLKPAATFKVNFRSFVIAEKVLKQLNLTENDYLYTAERGYLFEKIYDINTNFASLNIDKYAFYNNKNISKNIFSDGISKNITRNNRADLLKPYLIGGENFPKLQNYFYETYIKNLHSGQRICVLIFDSNDNFYYKPKNDFEYKINLYQLFISKVNIEIVDEISKYLKLTSTIEPSDKSFLILVYEK